MLSLDNHNKNFREDDDSKSDISETSLKMLAKMLDEKYTDR